VRAIVISNFYDADSGFVGERLRHHGYAFTEAHRERHGEWPSLDGVDLVLSLGSDWSVYWPHVAGEVSAESALIRTAHDQGTPVLGICYGNQIMAHSLGGIVERAREPEIGWFDIVSDLPEAIAPGPWFQWHSDVVTVPGAATELARSAVGPQAWRLGRSFCTQFHPELNEAMVVRWVRGGGAAEAELHGVDPEALITDTLAKTADSRPNCDRLVDWYLDTVASSN
jgi:GMP synthase-like glutamine amidotransferase